MSKCFSVIASSNRLVIQILSRDKSIHVRPVFGLDRKHWRELPAARR